MLIILLHLWSWVVIISLERSYWIPWKKDDDHFNIVTLAIKPPNEKGMECICSIRAASWFSKRNSNLRCGDTAFPVKLLPTKCLHLSNPFCWDFMDSLNTWTSNSCSLKASSLAPFALSASESPVWGQIALWKMALEYHFHLLRAYFFHLRAYFLPQLRM